VAPCRCDAKTRLCRRPPFSSPTAALRLLSFAAADARVLLLRCLTAIRSYSRRQFLLPIHHGTGRFRAGQAGHQDLVELGLLRVPHYVRPGGYRLLPLPASLLSLERLLTVSCWPLQSMVVSNLCGARPAQQVTIALLLQNAITINEFAASRWQIPDPNINSGGRTVGDQILFTRGIPLGMAHSGPYATPLMVASQFQLCKSQAFGMRASPRPGSCAVAVPIWTVQPPHGMT